ncbi:hypothetical protein TRIP_B250362 [uncultured Desulfatiglans sp.]|nr:hypothetical protein TRIP_B250362 [uncultured Desulfatiglans sp.]
MGSRKKLLSKLRLSDLNALSLFILVRFLSDINQVPLCENRFQVFTQECCRVNRPARCERGWSAVFSHRARRATARINN